jgi:hypothetical protein
MNYETIQTALTLSIEFVAIAGLGGIIAHALYSQHKHFMSTYCPAVTPFQAEVEIEEPEAEEAIAPIHDYPETTIEQASEPTDVSNPDHPEIDLNALDPAVLRKLCTQHQITWRHARGKNRHATKLMMIHQLQQQLTA